MAVACIPRNHGMHIEKYHAVLIIESSDFSLGWGKEEERCKKGRAGAKGTKAGRGKTVCVCGGSKGVVEAAASDERARETEQERERERRSRELTALHTWNSSLSFAKSSLSFRCIRPIEVKKKCVLNESTELFY